MLDVEAPSKIPTKRAACAPEAEQVIVRRLTTLRTEAPAAANVVLATEAPVTETAAVVRSSGETTKELRLSMAMRTVPLGQLKPGC